MSYGLVMSGVLRKPSFTHMPKQRGRSASDKPDLGSRGMFYLCCKNKFADQLCGFRSRFSHDGAHFFKRLLRVKM